MEPVQILDQDRESILARLSACEETQKAQKVLEEEMGRILVGSLKEGDFAGKEQELALMLGVAKAGVALMDTQAEPVVYERQREEGKASPFGEKRQLIAGVGLAALGALFPSVPLLGGLISLLRLGLVGVGMYLSYLGLKGKGIAAENKPEVVVKVGTDPEKVYHQAQILLQVGTELVRSLPEKKEEPSLPLVVDESLLDSELSEEEVKLLAGLLEAAISGEREALSEVESLVSFFLHRHGISVCRDYEENPSFFDRMPGRLTLLIRPALILDGQPLCRGLYVASHEKE